MIELSQIDMIDPRYQEERLLRNEVLLKPIGIPDFGWEKNDTSAWHFVAIKDNTVIGCVLLVPINSNQKKGQLTQMAVKSSAQGQGIGKLLVQFLLKFARNENLEEVVIHARDTVTPFYEQFGFKVFGQEFEEVGIIHRMMSIKMTD